MVDYIVLINDEVVYEGRDKTKVNYVKQDSTYGNNIIILEREDSGLTINSSRFGSYNETTLRGKSLEALMKLLE